MSPAGAYDAVILGAGPGGRGAAQKLAGEGLSVAMVEQELVGGECPYWACIPSKTLLRPVEAAGQAAHVPGLGAPPLDFGEVAEYRDYMNSGLDDTEKAKAIASQGVEVVRGHGRIAGPGRVEVGDRTLETSRIVVATGTTSAVPPVEGLDTVPYWTNREATTFTEVPESVTVLGGGPVGVELGQMLARYGARVTIVQGADRLLDREDASVGERLADLLSAEGIDVRLGLHVERAETSGGQIVVRLEDGERIGAEKLLVATGRRPRVGKIGLESAGVEPGERGIEVDEHCRAGEGIWAIGDVTGISPFTHVAAYQAGIACADILGEPRPADYRAIPRVVFCDPEVAAVGLTPDGARERGIRTVTSSVDLAKVDRTETYGRDLSGHLGVLADVERQVIVGAWAVAPLASEWIHSLVLAIKAELPLALLRDTIVQFPTFSEAIATAVGRIPAAERETTHA